jgi:hypothetical protein
MFVMELPPEGLGVLPATAFPDEEGTREQPLFAKLMQTY